MLVKEIIQRVQSLYSKGAPSDDSRLTDRHIYNKALTVRSKLISQEAKKKQKVNQWNYQTIPCVQLIEAPLNECPCLPPIGCTYYRSKEVLPKPLTDLNNHLIQSVTSLDGRIVYSEITWEEKKYKSGNKYTGNKPDYFIRNGYIYITHKKGSPTILAITGLWEDPIEAMEYFSACEDGSEIDCTSPLDSEFPMDLDMVDTLVEECVKELVILFSKMQEDLTNDGKDSRHSDSK